MGIEGFGCEILSASDTVSNEVASVDLRKHIFNSQQGTESDAMQTRSIHQPLKPTVRYSTIVATCPIHQTVALEAF